MIKHFSNKKPDTIQFTQEGLNKIQADFDRLTLERPLVLGRLQAAREMGDLSENGAYKAARFELSDIDRQLKKLRYLLHVAVVTPLSTTDTINFGNTVTLDSGTRTVVYQLVNGYESNPKEKKLSIHSPIGKALLGKRCGDVVVVQAPAGELKFTIVKVE